MGRIAYYLIWFLAAYGTQYPWLALGAVVFVLLGDRLPDPWVYLRTFARMRALRREIELNHANVVARRDLARMLLDRSQPRAALKLLEQARARFPDDAELLFLTGRALVGAGRPEEAIEPIVRAVDLQPGLLYGEPYRVAAEALHELGCLPEAEDAIERYLAANSSSLEGYFRLARIRRARGDAKGASEALAEASRTWRKLPSFKRRGQLTWWLLASMARVLL
jgi:predicted Zn-dependent protease